MMLPPPLRICEDLLWNRNSSARGASRNDAPTLEALGFDDQLAMRSDPQLNPLTAGGGEDG